MAERRMFTKKITESDAFLDMPMSTQCLYFHLNMAADDDGFVNSPKRIQRLIGASDDDMKLLIAKSFIILFESGVIVIKHWKMHNYIQSDRYKPTDYADEKNLLKLKKNKAYTLNGYNLDTKCIQDVSVGKDRLGKDSIGKDSINNINNTKETLNTMSYIIMPDESDNKIPSEGGDEGIAGKSSAKKFVPPTIDEVAEYCKERGNRVDPERFIDYYKSQKWKKANGQPLSDWKAAVRTWEKNDYNTASKHRSLEDMLNDFD